MFNIMDAFRLDGKIAVVTGGSGLYGRQEVLALAQAGAKVCNASRNVEKNEAYAAELRAQGYDVFVEQLDQGDEKSIAAFVDRMEQKFGRIDVLVNNAVFRGMANDEDWEGFTTSLRINAIGMSALSMKVAKLMKKNGGGSIVNIGSYMGILGADDTLYRDTTMTQVADVAPDYFYHKGGMANWTRLMASKFGPDNVRVNVLQLGGFFNHQPEKFVERYNDRTFLKRMANDTDIMGAVVWLASEASAYVTGQSIPVDGGYSAK
ncbi:MAG: SDR family oxidoreductase [Clostridia bacterium]|nr:SDR family oxidoreductase [Clostridia bacterium]